MRGEREPGWGWAQPAVRSPAQGRGGEGAAAARGRGGGEPGCSTESGREPQPQRGLRAGARGGGAGPAGCRLLAAGPKSKWSERGRRTAQRRAWSLGAPQGGEWGVCGPGRGRRELQRELRCCRGSDISAHSALATRSQQDLPPRTSHLTDEKIEAPRGQVTLKVTQEGSGRVSRGWLWLVPRKSPPENSVEEPSPPLPSPEEYV